MSCEVVVGVSLTSLSSSPGQELSPEGKRGGGREWGNRDEREDGREGKLRRG